MVIDLFALKKSPFEFEYQIESNEIDLESETVKLKNTVAVKGKLTKHIIQVDVAGEIAAVVETECSRCLQSAIEKIEFQYNVGYITPENYTEEKEAELNIDDLQISIFDGAQIDIDELVREQILLNLPEQSFCRKDCKGLCQQCGANRNLIDCRCIEKEIDPRWSALKNLNRG